MSSTQPITGLRGGDVAPQVFLCGDPARVDLISQGWETKREVCQIREYRVVSGSWNGIPISAASTGIGGPSTAILLEELVKVGANSFIRIGNSGGLAPDLEIGDLVITAGAVRDDGTSRSYIYPEYPAVADHRLVSALVDSAVELKVRHKSGITWSLDAFYIRNAILDPEGSMTSMSVNNYWTREHSERIEAMRTAKVLNCEMEAGTLLTLANIFGVRAACICVVSDLTPWPGPAAIDLDRNMKTCIEVAHIALSRIETSR